jgi:hypothetical protein
VAGTVDQDDAMGPCQPLAERAHHFEVGTRAMEHHDRRAGGVARAEIDDVEGTALDLEFRLIFCTSELRPGSARVSEVVHRVPILWIAGS